MSYNESCRSLNSEQDRILRISIFPFWFCIPIKPKIGGWCLINCITEIASKPQTGKLKNMTWNFYHIRFNPPPLGVKSFPLLPLSQLFIHLTKIGG